jgi:hypothetical protein
LFVFDKICLNISSLMLNYYGIKPSKQTSSG